MGMGSGCASGGATAQAWPCCMQGRRHRYVYGYNSNFEVPSIGIAKVGPGCVM